MTATAVVRCADPSRLAQAMARHFAHKVPVARDGEVARVTLAAGGFELEPRADGLAVRAQAGDADGLEHVRRVVTDHLTRFARPETVEVAWEQQEASLTGGER